MELFFRLSLTPRKKNTSFRLKETEIIFFHLYKIDKEETVCMSTMQSFISGATMV